VSAAARADITVVTTEFWGLVLLSLVPTLALGYKIALQVSQFGLDVGEAGHAAASGGSCFSSYKEMEFLSATDPSTSTTTTMALSIRSTPARLGPIHAGMEQWNCPSHFLHPQSRSSIPVSRFRSSQIKRRQTLGMLEIPVASLWPLPAFPTRDSGVPAQV
jgi:hypothetical protein